MIHLVSLSGGKDSVAALCWAKRSGLQPRAVAADTGWEWDGWRAYVDDVARRLDVPLVVVRGKEQFIERLRRYSTWPHRRRRWCTQELKLAPIAAEVERLREESGDEITVIVGIRHEEGSGRGDDGDRATWPEREWNDTYDAEEWRPIIDWTLAQVIAEHHRAGVPLNPLYHRGAERVGCWPCINSGKDEIRLIAETDPARIELIAQLERDTGHAMFWLGGGRQPHIETPIAEVVAWSRTSRGGKHLTLWRAPSGCARWGLCETAEGAR